jgi:hypothetical protein
MDLLCHNNAYLSQCPIVVPVSRGRIENLSECRMHTAIGYLIYCLWRGKKQHILTLVPGRFFSSQFCSLTEIIVNVYVHVWNTSGFDFLPLGMSCYANKYIKTKQRMLLDVNKYSLPCKISPVRLFFRQPHYWKISVRACLSENVSNSSPVSPT